jgi:hypothetical protein
VGDFITNASATPVIQRMDLMRSDTNTSAALRRLPHGISHRLQEFRFGDTTFNPATGGFTMRTLYTSTKATGLEFEGTARPVKWFDRPPVRPAEARVRRLRFTQVTNNVPTTFNLRAIGSFAYPRSARVIPGFNLLGSKLAFSFRLSTTAIVSQTRRTA